MIDSSRNNVSTVPLCVCVSVDHFVWDVDGFVVSAPDIDTHRYTITDLTTGDKCCTAAAATPMCRLGDDTRQVPLLAIR
jgi:hypothetical protein